MWKVTDASAEQQKPSAASSAGSRPKSGGGSAAPQEAVIGRSLLIRGEITGSESLCIEGCVEGSISFPDYRVTVGREGKVKAGKAGISAGEIVVIGSVCGNLNGSNGVDIRSEGSVTGDVVAEHIRVEEGAFLKGSIDTGKPSQHGDGGSSALRQSAEQNSRQSGVAAGCPN